MDGQNGLMLIGDYAIINVPNGKSNSILSIPCSAGSTIQLSVWANVTKYQETCLSQ